MTADQLAQLQSDLDEVNAQLREMTGSASFSVAGFSVDEKDNYDRLVQRKATLEFRIGNPNGDVTDNFKVTSPVNGGLY